MKEIRRNKLEHVISLLDDLRLEIEDICGDEDYLLERHHRYCLNRKQLGEMEIIIDLLEDAAAKVGSAVEDLEQCIQR